MDKGQGEAQGAKIAKAPPPRTPPARSLRVPRTANPLPATAHTSHQTAEASLSVCPSERLSSVAAESEGLPGALALPPRSLLCATAAARACSRTLASASAAATFSAASTRWRAASAAASAAAASSCALRRSRLFSACPRSRPSRSAFSCAACRMQRVAAWMQALSLGAQAFSCTDCGAACHAVHSAVHCAVAYAMYDEMHHATYDTTHDAMHHAMQTERLRGSTEARGCLLRAMLLRSAPRRRLARALLLEQPPRRVLAPSRLRRALLHRLPLVLGPLCRCRRFFRLR
eukprot:scaffold44920_cov38-Phaeocystis_antarctica.AAC.1